MDKNAQVLDGLGRYYISGGRSEKNKNAIALDGFGSLFFGLC